MWFFKIYMCFVTKHPKYFFFTYSSWTVDYRSYVVIPDIYLIRQSGLFIIAYALKKIQIVSYAFVMTLLLFRTEVTFMGFGLGHGILGLGL